jgi:RNA polymerase sigma-70 factor (ECF subfamily)
MARTRSKQAGAPPASATAASADLLVRFRDGDEGAFREIVGAFETRLVQFFYRLCWDRDRAEDFTQDLFVKLLRGAARYRPEGRLSTFIFRVAKNLWIDHYRAARPQPRLYSLDQPVHGTETTWAALAPADDPAPIESAAADEEKRRLRAALETLTEPHRLVFEFAIYQGLPYAEVGEILDIPVGTVKSRMHNAVKALRELLGDRGAGGAAQDSFRSAPRAFGEGVG